jgi:hypothetical protein
VAVEDLVVVVVEAVGVGVEGVDRVVGAAVVEAAAAVVEAEEDLVVAAAAAVGRAVVAPWTR